MPCNFLTAIVISPYNFSSFSCPKSIRYNIFFLIKKSRFFGRILLKSEFSLYKKFLRGCNITFLGKSTISYQNMRYLAVKGVFVDVFDNFYPLNWHFSAVFYVLRLFDYIILAFFVNKRFWLHCNVNKNKNSAIDKINCIKIIEVVSLFFFC